MKQRIFTSLGLAVLACVSLVTPASAVVSMSWTSIGNAGNTADTTGYGAVDHAYNIGTYEVTNAQYCEFLNAKGGSNSSGIFNLNMGNDGIAQNGSSGSYTYSVSSTYANLPMACASWFDAARFSNWLGNGQGSGSMEMGAYTLNGATSGIATVNVGATVYIPTENEWYKAAYYNGSTSSYSLYPNGQNTITTADSNFNGIGLADVGYGAPSPYGTYGQGGNAWEWNESVIGSSRGLRGGACYFGGDASLLASLYRDFADPSSEGSNIGFRVASVPEPSSLVLTILASGLLVTRRKR